MRRLLILFALATAFIGIGELEAQECERLYPKGLNTQCRAVQTPTVSHVSLEAVAMTHPTEPEKDYCRLDFIAHGELSQFKEAVESGTVRLIDRVHLATSQKYNDRIRAQPLEWTDQYLRATLGDKGLGRRRLTYSYINRYGLPETLEELKDVLYVGAYVREGEREYFVNSPISTPRESTNLPALYRKCLSDIELAREGVERRIYVTKQEIAVELARASAQAEVTFLQKEIAFMQEAVVEMEVAIGKAEEAIDQMLAHRRTLLLVEETFGNILNAFWSGTFSKYQSFSAWANERLESIDNQLNEAEQYKKDIEAIEIEFLIQLNETKQRAAEKAREIEELGEGQ